MSVPQRKYAARAASVGLVLLMAGIMAGCGEKKQQRQSVAVVPVTVATAVQKDVPVQITAIGTVESMTGVAVKSQVSGEITSIHFKEGDDVKKGQLLFTIDKRPTEADLRRAEATLARDQANAANARAEAKRYQALFKEGVVASQQAEDMQTAADAAEALVNADHAAVINAKVQLEYTNIYSPINGRTGTVTIQLGNVVKANDLPLVTINQINPIYVAFTIPEQMLPEVKKFMAQHKLQAAAALPNDPKPAIGTLTFVDNIVDRQTGTIKLKASFDNNDRRLWPGQFVNTSLTLTTQPNAVVVPSQAVQNGQQGQFVFVINKEMAAESRQVTVSRIVGDQSVIAGEVQAGEVVVTDGQLRLTPGVKVEVKGNNPGQGQNAEARKQGQTS